MACVIVFATVITVLTGSVYGNTVIAAASAVIEYEFVLIIVISISASHNVVGREDLGLAYSESVTLTTDTLTILVRIIGIVFIDHCAVTANAIVLLVGKSVITNVIDAIRVSAVAVERTSYALTVSARTAMILYVSAASTVISKIILSYEIGAVVCTILVCGVTAVKTSIVYGNATLTVFNTVEGVGRSIVVVLLPSAFNVSEAVNDYCITNGYCEGVIACSVTSVDHYVVISYDGKSALCAYSRVRLVGDTVFVDVVIPFSGQTTVVDSLVVIFAVFARTAVRVNVVVNTAYAVISEIVAFIDVCQIVIVIITVIRIGVRTILTGNVNGYAILTVLSITVEFKLKLIVMVCSLAGAYVMSFKDSRLTHLEDVAIVSVTVAALIDSVCIKAVSQAAFAAEVIDDPMCSAVFINNITAIAGDIAISAVAYATFLTARTLGVLDVSAASAYIGKIDLLFKDGGVVATGFIVAVITHLTRVMKGNAILTVLYSLIEGVGRNTVGVAFSSGVNVIEAINDDLVTDRYGVGVGVINLTSNLLGMSVSYDGKSTLVASSGVDVVGYAVLVSGIAVASAHRTVIYTI